MGLDDGSPDKLTKVLKNLIVMLVRRRGAPALELPSKFIHSTLMISKSPLKLIPKDLCHQFSFHLTNMSTSVVDVKLLQKVIAKNEPPIMSHTKWERSTMLCNKVSALAALAWVNLPWLPWQEQS